MDSDGFIRYCNTVPYMTYRGVCRNIANQAMSFVGQGDYGTAFLLSDGKVGKIFKSWDRAYCSFLSLVGHSNNPHLPRVYAKGTQRSFSYVVLEYLNPYVQTVYMRIPFSEMLKSMSEIILCKSPSLELPSSLADLAYELKDSAKGFCLDFRRDNFAMRDETLVTLDPFTLKTSLNTHLTYVE